jgi:hypothetical protein
VQSCRTTFLRFDKTKDTAFSRGAFATLALGTGASIAASTTAADAAVVETDVVIKMHDGYCDAALFHPAARANRQC